eukprot:9396880-Pyramimonas_sp.AAC.1
MGSQEQQLWGWRAPCYLEAHHPAAFQPLLHCERCGASHPSDAGAGDAASGGGVESQSALAGGGVG